MSGTGFILTVDGAKASELGLAFQGRLEEVVQKQKRGLEVAHVKAANAVMRKDKAELRADIAQGGFYQAARLSKTWQGSVFPNSAPTLEPAIWLRSKAKTIIDAFTSGATITVHNAEYLAIPEGPAKGIIHALNRDRTKNNSNLAKGDREDNPVARVAAALGVRLIPIIDQATGHGVLIAEDSRRLTPTGRQAKQQRGNATVLFVLVKQATLRKRIKGRALIEQLRASFLADFSVALTVALPSDQK